MGQIDRVFRVNLNWSNMEVVVVVVVDRSYEGFLLQIDYSIDKRFV